ncbi:MAG: SMC family ATPase [Thermoplasmata archaeon]
MTMRIAHVGLRNLRSYRTADLNLDPGTTLLTGDIGSGKTSLLYAMEMALFGFAEVDPGYLVRHGAKDAEVSLTLTDGTHRWELRRRFVRKARKGRDTFEPTENSLAVDGQRAAYSATELRRRTIELLGFPDNPNPRAHSDVWRWAVYLAQERMRDVLDPDVDARMETVRKALGVEQYRLAGENARGMTRALQERAATLLEQAARHRGVEDEAARWRDQAGVAQQQILALDGREQKLRDEVRRARVSLEELEVLRRESAAVREAVAHQERLARELERSIQQDQAAVGAAREHLGRLEADRVRESTGYSSEEENALAVGPLRTRRDEAAHRLSGLEGLRGQTFMVAEQLVLWTERDRELKARLQATRHELEKVQADRARADASPPVEEPRPPDPRAPLQLAAERNQLEDQRQDFDRRWATATAELSELGEIVRDGVCPRCHRSVEPSEFEAHRREQETLVSGLQVEVETATQRLHAADQRMLTQVEHERLHDRWVELHARRTELRQREDAVRLRSEAEHRLESQLEGEKAALDTRREALEQQLTAYEPAQTDLATIERDLRAAEDHARLLAARKERLAALLRQIPEVQAEIDTRARNAAERETTRAEVLGQIAVARARLPAPNDLEERWSDGRTRVDALGKTLESLLRDAVEPRGRAVEATTRLEDLARRLREREALDRQSSELRGLADWIDKQFRNAMLELERRRLQQGRLQFERWFAQYFAALVDDPSLNARVDETFAPWVDIAGQPTPAEALSGGERTALALAYRLALGRTVRDAGRLALETLILDEPTEGFSQEQTLRMGDLLESLGLPQVILVSHERQLEGIADRVVRVRKKDGVSLIEEIDRLPETGPPSTLTSHAPPGPQAPTPRRRRIRRLSDLDAVALGEAPSQAK